MLERLRVSKKFSTELLGAWSRSCLHKSTTVVYLEHERSTVAMLGAKSLLHTVSALSISVGSMIARIGAESVARIFGFGLNWERAVLNLNACSLP